MTLFRFVRLSIVTIGLVMVLAPYADSSVRFVVGPLLLATAYFMSRLALLADEACDSRAVFGTFYWGGGLPSDEQEDQWQQHRVTEPIARSVHVAASQNVDVDVDEPYAEDHGSYVEFKLNGWRCMALFQWAPCDRRRNCFSFYVWFRQHAIHRLLHSAEFERQRAALRRAIVSILEASDDITDVALDRRAE